MVNLLIDLTTPLLELDLYIIRNTFGIPTAALLSGVTPFVIVLFIFLALLFAFP